MAHDFKKFPELTDAQMELYYFQSPHKQITADFRAKCVKVHDGDTITLEWYNRGFTFPLRFLNTQAPELKEPGGAESQGWLERKLLGQEIEIKISPGLRVEKWGRLLGQVMLNGMDVGEESINAGMSIPWSHRGEGKIPNFDEELKRAW